MLCPLGPYRQEPHPLSFEQRPLPLEWKKWFFCQGHFPLIWRITRLQPNSSIYPFPACKIPRVWQLSFIFVLALYLLVVVSTNDLTVICSKMLSGHAPGAPSRTCGGCQFFFFCNIIGWDFSRSSSSSFFLLSSSSFNFFLSSQLLL